MSEFNINARSSIVAIIYLAVIGPCLFILQPGYVQGLVEYVGLTEPQAGYVASAEIFGIALTTIALIILTNRLDWRKIALLSLLVAAVGNLASWNQADPQNLGILRFLTGMGSGGVISITFTMAGLTEKTDRNFGAIVFWVLIYGAFGLLAMPTIYHSVGMNGLLILLAIFNLSGLVFIKFLPQSAGHVDAPVGATRPYSSGLTWLTAMSYFIYCVGIGVVWAYLFLVGVEAGIAEQTVASWLTVSQFLGAAGAFVTVILQKRLGRFVPLNLAILAGAGAIGLLLQSIDVVIYALAVCGFNFLWNVAMPYFLAVLADLDYSGRMVMIGVAMQMTGFALGPAIAAWLLQFGSYVTVNTAAIVFWLVSVVLAVPGLWAQHKRPREVHLRAAS